MALSILQVDAFAAKAFQGNPAAVCLLDAPKSADWMQHVATEMNQPMTAFIMPRANGDSGGNEAELHWFNAAGEVPLCGHATLAGAHAWWETGRQSRDREIRFHTVAGVLVCRRDGKLIEMDFPALPIQEAELPSDIAEAVGIRPHGVFCRRRADGSNGNFLLTLDSEAAVRSLNPNFEALRKLLKVGVIVTARSDSPEFDFVSRYFAGYLGIDEDFVTGSAHCIATPYWASVLGKTEMTAYQASPRGGVLRVKAGGDRVFLAGEAITVWRGNLLC